MIRSYRGRRVRRSKPVEVYRNLHRAGVCYSVRQFGRVVAHADSVELLDAAFVVNAAGHARAVRTGQRNVHAWVRGFLATSPRPSTFVLDRLRYSLQAGTFTTVAGERVLCAPYVQLNSSGLFASLRESSFGVRIPVDIVRANS